ncbi:unnamed protein product, partial [Mesorhabditis spiculigera]
MYRAMLILRTSQNSLSGNFRGLASASRSVHISITYNPDELTFGRPMIQRIKKDLAERNCVVSLPEERLLDLLSPIFEKLLGNGVRPGFLITECSQSEHLLQTMLSEETNERLVKICKILVEYCTYSFEEALLSLKSIDYDLSQIESAENVSNCLQTLLNITGVEFGDELGELVRRFPPIIFVQDGRKMQELYESLRSFFSKKQLTNLIKQTPQILLGNFEELEPKYEYIFYQMGLEGEEFIGCSSWVEMDLDEIMQRHGFLLKAGRYTFPDKKNPQIRTENPELRRILDSDDENFAIQVAGVTPEEWTIYKLLDRRTREEADSDEPFARTKPSMRKLMERRRKLAAKQKEDFVMDTSSRID